MIVGVIFPGWMPWRRLALAQGIIAKWPTRVSGGAGGRLHRLRIESRRRNAICTDAIPD